MSAGPPEADVERVVAVALAEDLGPRGDLTAQLLDPTLKAVASVVAREHGIVAGEACAVATFASVDPSLEVTFARHDGESVSPGDVVATVRGALSSIVTAERTALNFLCHLSGIATATRALVDAVQAQRPGTQVLDTRKTLPGLRSIEKAAVRAGGGTSHRASLSEAVLLKDNHLAVLGVADGVAAARARWPEVRVQVECDTIGQVQEAIDAGADAVLLDNMSPEDAARCVALARARDGALFVEASGGITLERASAYAAAGVDAVSSGALTHSARALDLGLDVGEG